MPPPAAPSQAAPARPRRPPPPSPQPHSQLGGTHPIHSRPAINLIPDAYLGRQYDEVRSELIGLKLGVTGAEVFNNATPGTVINIEPSGPVQPGTSHHRVSYSKGPEMVTVPSIPAGASEAAVQQAIQDAGLRWVTGAPRRADRTRRNRGTFVSSDPAPGQQGGSRIRSDVPPGQGRNRLTNSFQIGTVGMSTSPRTPSHREDRRPDNTQRVLSGRYELGELIGRGGMADVFRGLDTRLGRTVAVKLLRPDLARDPQFQARFKREAQAVAALNHPSIVAVYDTGDHAVPGDHDDSVRVPYIVMEFVSGTTIRDLIRAKEVTIDQAIDFTLGVLSALDYSHKAKIVHRDIKPANVMFGPIEQRQGHGLRHRPRHGGFGRDHDADPGRGGHGPVPVSGAGARRDRGRPQRPVFCRLPAVRDADRPAAVRRGQPRFGGLPARAGDPRAGQQPEPRSLRRPGQRPDEGPAEEPGGPLPGRRGLPARPPRGARRRRSRRRLVPARLPPSPTDTVPGPDRIPPTAAFSLTGAQFLDDAPGGRLRPAGDASDDDAVLPDEGTAVYPAADTGSLPLVLPADANTPSRQKSRRRTWIATLVVLTLLVLAGGGLWLYNMMNQQPPPVAKVLVPSVTSLTESEALQRLYNAGLKPQLNRLRHETIAKGIAIGTAPASGSSLEPNADIMLNISDGPSAITIPADLPGRTEAAARDVLRQKGLTGAPVHHDGQQPHGSGRHRHHHQTRAGPERGRRQHRRTRRLQRQGGHAPADRAAAWPQAEAALKDLGLGDNGQGSRELPGRTGQGDRPERRRGCARSNRERTSR